MQPVSSGAIVGCSEFGFDSFESFSFWPGGVHGAVVRLQPADDGAAFGRCLPALPERFAGECVHEAGVEVFGVALLSVVGRQGLHGDDVSVHDRACVAPGSGFNAARLLPGCHGSRRARRLPRPDVRALPGGQRRAALPALGGGAAAGSVQEVKGVGAVVDEVHAGPVGHNGQPEQGAVRPAHRRSFRAYR